MMNMFTENVLREAVSHIASASEDSSSDQENRSSDAKVTEFLGVLSTASAAENSGGGLLGGLGGGGLFGDLNPLSSLPGGDLLGGALGAIDDGFVSPILGSEVAQKIAPMVGFAFGGPIGSSIATAVTTAAAQEDGILNDQGGINTDNVMTGASKGASSYFLGGFGGVGGDATNATNGFNFMDLINS